MVEIFDEKRIQRQNAIFDIQRLNYLNSQWIKKMPIEDLFQRLSAFIPADWNDAKVKQILMLVKERMFTLRDFAPAAEYFFKAPSVNVQSVLDQSGHTEKKQCIGLRRPNQLSKTSLILVLQFSMKS
jgi:glutamyl/glutaminyl-tRNA synthetase